MSEFPDTEKPRFIYWEVNARALNSMLLLSASNVEYTWDSQIANSWPKSKETMPFGQLPVLLHNDMTIAQSGTITRYCAKLAKLVSLDDKHNWNSDMMFEHCNDIYDIFGKAKYWCCTKELKEKHGWFAVRNTILPNKLKWIESKLKDSLYLNGDNVEWGDICIFSLVTLIEQAGLFDVLKNFPNILSHYGRISKFGGIQKYFEKPRNPYFISE